MFFFEGVLLAIFEKASVISPVINPGQTTSAGTVSAGYQNFLICIEMLFAAIALRYAFPYQIYAAGCVTDSRGRSVTMQSISSSLKVNNMTFNIDNKLLICRSNIYCLFYFLGNNESKRHNDWCYSQFPSAVPTVHAVQFRFVFLILYICIWNFLHLIFFFTFSSFYVSLSLNLCGMATFHRYAFDMSFH